MSKNKLTATNNDFFFTWAPLKNDLAKLYDIVSLDEDRSSNRTFTKTLFCMVEAVSFRMRQIMLERYENELLKISAEEYIVLSEIRVEIDSKGKIKQRPGFYNFSEMFLFTFRTYCSHYDKMEIYSKYLSDYRYEAFTKSVLIRNKLTHPKSVFDINISKGNTSNMLLAYEWFDNFMMDVLYGDLIIDYPQNSD
jgi:hypothetical protein